MLSRAFQIRHCACVKTKVERRLVNSACYKLLALLFNMISWSYIVDKMQVNIQEVEHDLRQIEKIDSRLYNNDDTQRVVQELGSKYTNEQQQLCKFCFFNWDALRKDAVGQNLIPDDIFLPRSKFQGKLNSTP